MPVELVWDGGVFRLLISDFQPPRGNVCSFCAKRKPVLALLKTSLISDCPSTPFSDKTLEVVKKFDFFSSPIGIKEFVILLARRHDAKPKSKALARALSMLIDAYFAWGRPVMVATTNRDPSLPGKLSHPQIMVFVFDIGLPFSPSEDNIDGMLGLQAESLAPDVSAHLARLLERRKQMTILFKGENLYFLSGGSRLPWPISALELAGMEVEVEEDGD